jgi:hypothetical protein
MRNLFVGFILGVVISSVGFTGVARMLDHGVDVVKETSHNLAN